MTPSASSLAAFQDTLLNVQASPFTGDVSLDAFLAVLEPKVRDAVVGLAIPHWFDEEALNRVADRDEVPRETLQDQLHTFPFVREHDRGLTYHEEARSRLRSALLERDPDRYREVCRTLAPAYPEPGEDPSAIDAEVWAEHLFLRYAYDEDAAIGILLDVLPAKRRERDWVVTRLLVRMLGEQRPLLSPAGAAVHTYVRGLLDFDEVELEAAEKALNDPSLEHLPARLRGHAGLYRGRILEERDEYVRAIEEYERQLESMTAKRDGAEFLVPALHQHVAASWLELGRLDRAERHVRTSLRLNGEAKDRYGELLNEVLLGRVYRRLRDRPGARRHFHLALRLADELALPYQRSEILIYLGRIERDEHKHKTAEALLSDAISLKVKIGDHHGLITAYAEMGRLTLARERRDEALGWYDTALRLARQVDDDRRIVAILRTVAVIHARMGRLTDAIETQKSAMVVTPPGSIPYDTLRAELQGLEGDLEHSRKPFARRHAGWLALAAVVALIALALVFSESFYESQVRTELEAAEAEILRDGSVVTLRRFWSLEQSDETSFTFLARAGHEYDVAAVCGHGCPDLDLQLYRGETLLDEDALPDPRPRITWRPEETGYYYAVARMYACDAAPCYFGMVVVEHPSAEPAVRALNEAIPELIQRAAPVLNRLPPDTTGASPEG